MTPRRPRMDECIELECDPELVAQARSWLRALLEAWETPEHLDDVVLIASELLTNAVLHARTSIQLKVSCQETTVRLEVHDENSRLPTLGSCPADATSGRGLALVASLATSWGIENREDGKTVWAEIGTATHDSPDDCVDLRQARSVDDAIGPGGLDHDSRIH